MNVLMWMLLACEVGRVGPAPAGAPSADELAALTDIEAQAAEVERLAFALEQESDRVRRGETPDGTQAGGVPKLQAMAAELAAANDALQADVEALESRLSDAAKAQLDPLRPPAPPADE